MHHRKGCIAMNKQVILEMTINTPDTLLCMSDFVFSQEKIMLLIQE